MHTRSKLALAGLAATLLMAFAVNSASARTLVSSSETLRATWRSLEFFGRSGLGDVTVRCPVTLEGSFHSRTIVKTIGSLIGMVTRAIVGPRPHCTNGAATILTESLPWHLTYEGFTGALPNITGIRILLRRTAFQVELLGILCLYADNGAEESRAEGTANRNTATREITEITPNNTIRLPKFSGSSLCPGSGGFTSASNRPTVLNGTAAITVTLI